MKQAEKERKFQTDPDCVWCHGFGTISIPDYSEISRLALVSKCLSGDWCCVPKVVTYCHHCYGSDTPLVKDSKELRYSNLLKSMQYAINSGVDYYELFKSCLIWVLSGWHVESYARKLVSDLENGIYS